MGFEPPVKTFYSLTPAVDSIPLFSLGILGYRSLMSRVGFNNRLCPVLPLNVVSYIFTGIAGVADHVVRMEFAIGPPRLA